MKRTERKICEVLGAKWVTRDKGVYVVELYRKRPKIIGFINATIFDSNRDDWIADVNCELFPSVKMGDCICVEEASGK